MLRDNDIGIPPRRGGGGYSYSFVCAALLVCFCTYMDGASFSILPTVSTSLEIVLSVRIRNGYFVPNDQKFVHYV